MYTDEDMRSYATSLGPMTEDELFREMEALEENSDAASKKGGAGLDEVLARIVIVEQEIEQRFPGQALAPFKQWLRARI